MPKDVCQSLVTIKQHLFVQKKTPRKELSSQEINHLSRQFLLWLDNLSFSTKIAK